MDKEKQRLEELQNLLLQHKETIDKLNSLCEELTGIKSVKQFVDMYSDIIGEKYTLMKAQQVGTTVAGLRRLAYKR